MSVWGVDQVATWAGITPSNVRARLARGQMPPPDGRIGRSPWWRPETIKAWRPRA